MGHAASLQTQVEGLLAGKSVAERAILASNVAARLGERDRPLDDRRATEELARRLAQDAIETVRKELAEAVKLCRFLPRDVAIMLAHDIDEIACPFLEVAEVFSEQDWQRLVRSVSPGACVAIARRPDLGEGTVEVLARVGDTRVAETLVGNVRAPITVRAYSAIITRFRNSQWILESMVERRALPAEVALMLISKVSEAARQRLARDYGLIDFTDPVTTEATDSALLRIIRMARDDQALVYARSLHRLGRLETTLIRTAIRSGLVEFFEAALAVRAGIPIENAETLLRRGGREGLARLCEQAGIPDALVADFRSALRQALGSSD